MEGVDTLGLLLTRRERRLNGVKAKLVKPQWVDPYPWVQGTRPEKRIYEALVARHIFFHFQILLSEAVPDTKGLPVLNMKPYRADFLLPVEKVVIDPWDDFHHAQPDQARADAEKLAVYQALGFTTYYFWANDLERYGAAWALDQIPELPAYGDGRRPKLWHTQDDTAGIASANAARRKFPSPELRRRVNRGRRRG